MTAHCFKLLLPAAALLMMGCEHAAHEAGAGDEGDHEPAVVVHVQKAEERSILKTVTALGRCEAPPEKLALLTPAIEGQVKEILARQGQHVEAGEAIVELDTILAEADVAEKQAARDSLAASLALLKSVPRTEEQQSSKLAIEQAKIAVARAEALVERLKTLRSRNELSEQQMFDAEQALAQARLQQRTAEAQFAVLMLAPRPEAIAEAEAKMKVAEEALKLAQARLELHTIRAPIEGMLDSLTCRPGQTIAVGASIGEIVDSEQVLAVAWMPIKNGQQVHIGQTAYVRNASRAAVSDEPEESSQIAGEVVFVGGIVHAQTGNVAVHVLIENPEEEGLIVGQTIEVEVLVDRSAATVCVPLAAIHDEGEGPAITVVREGKCEVLHPQLGPSHGRWIAVSGTDLEAGEPVIVEGAYNLPEGTEVKVEGEGEAEHEREPAMSEAAKESDAKSP